MITREVLNADGMSLSIVPGDSGNVGIGLSGTWAGTVYFEQAVKDNPTVWIADSQTPFPSGTKVSSATANGNWFSQVQANVFAKRVRFSLTSGSLIAIMAAANDASWQDAFLAAGGSGGINRSSTATSGTNTLTQSAQANRAQKLTFAEVCFAGTYFGGAGRLTIFDGTVAGTILFEEFIQPPTVAGSVGWKQQITLPPDGIVGTPGNAMTMVLLGFPAQATIINAKFGAG